MTTGVDWDFGANLAAYFAALSIMVGIGLLFLAAGIWAIRAALMWRRK